MTPDPSQPESPTLDLVPIVEALVTASEDALDSEKLAETVRRAAAGLIGQAEAAEEAPAAELKTLAAADPEDVEAAIAELNRAYEEAGRALAVVRRPRGWRLVTRTAYAAFVEALFPDHRPRRLSGPALETLAIIAYRQPVTKAEIESVRGVAADGMLQKLLDLELVKIGGRADLPGRPLQYVTTEQFLDQFNLASPEDLPNAPELQRVQLPSAEVANTEAREAAGNGETAPEGAAEQDGETGEARATDGDQPPPSEEAAREEPAPNN